MVTIVSRIGHDGIGSWSKGESLINMQCVEEGLADTRRLFFCMRKVALL